MQQPLLHKIFILFIFLGSFSALAQPKDRLSGFSSRPTEENVAPSKKKTMALSLPVIDDFSYDSHQPNPNIWLDQNVYVNQTYCTSPITLGVATFDGLDKDGIAYDIGVFGTDTADILTSQPIDLSSPTDSVYLSFFWQAGGHGDLPENSDSLALYFYTPQASTWSSIWRISGVDTLTRFKQEMIPVPVAYHKADFQFRLISYGARAGAFDMWNIDYVRLDDSRTINDTLFNDVSFTQPYPPLIKTYDAMPWFHYASNVVNKPNENFFYRKNNNGATQSIQVCRYGIFLGPTLLDGNVTGLIDPNQGVFNAENVFNCAYNNFYPSPVPSNEFEITAFQSYDGSNEDPATETNDTIWRHQQFRNYYSYDDGSAEQAYLVDDNAGGFMLSRFGIAQADDLMGLYIYFLPSEFNIEDNQFTIVVYESDNEAPGNLIYESDTIYTPRFTSTNFLLPYPIKKDINSGVNVSGTVFVGIKQVKNTPIPIGFDMNSNLNVDKIFYGKPNDYYTSFIAGNLMIRPYFRYLPNDFDLPETTIGTVGVNVFPNPANQEITIESTEQNDNLQFVIYNISGQAVQSGSVNGTVQLNNQITSGIYLLQVIDASGKKAPYTQKLVIEK
ncbi:hypothetical protein Oweho_1744 [Owenweeksia hongkongensis DSM 17368]|uniref:Secretion system C-terminal sorting domain-containing protein n=1 Tax=Owenweeksia hongkongensis (strain DSM 17368 / CIP 108786 / JCM 12287 / NRRL B-23963 / UST20020801) TaxID=926562 RepID=G8R0M7_OWEHD|nr:T9SS type A sorting domain-containing protein [Owenweeksia hongkongensis]AEV32731.1 hypothetical protein Oweho_1744 [Owenweeksia hongkongensis DSM 17368]